MISVGEGRYGGIGSQAVTTLVDNTATRAKEQVVVTEENSAIKRTRERARAGEEEVRRRW